jgi:ribosomal-protein-alanine N-acetyltransferase
LTPRACAALGSWPAAVLAENNTLLRLMTSGQHDPFSPIETDRLVLRCVRPGDAAAVSALLTPEVTRWLASWPSPFTRTMAEERIARAREAAAEGHALPLAIERRTDAAFLGWITIGRHKAEAARGILGYWLGEAHQREGYGLEAACAAVRTAFRLLDLDVIEAGARPDNVGSFAIMRRLGMRPAGERMVFEPAHGREALCLVYELAHP